MIRYLYAALAALMIGGTAVSAAKEPPSPTVHVLVEGYVRPIEGREFVPGVKPDGARRVAGTVVLVKAADATIVADPGMVADRRLIVEGLKQRGVTPGDVTHVFISHHHPDHTVNVGMFPNAKVIDFHGEYDRDVWRDRPDRSPIVAGVWVLRTPGHTDEDASLVIEGEEGVTVLTHLWWTEQRQPTVDPIAEAPKQLDLHRLKVLEIADWIIPGHGKRFANPRKDAVSGRRP